MDHHPLGWVVPELATVAMCTRLSTTLAAEFDSRMIR